ncbi:hypothetical protein BP6252_01403 [Coleophoma cylindrospora]|uniref:Uncharacterized protein n=1 Tax=Coleophoma cylindrospora TaxID=1849047 RepID=A0A3D8ST78_9HELO|nr:hypothetical protein BP6252_01403 [Coleophoma cylindrospora]
MDSAPLSKPTSPPLPPAPTRYVLEPFAQQIWEIDQLQKSYAEHAKKHKYAKQNSRRGRKSFDGSEPLFGFSDAAAKGAVKEEAEGAKLAAARKRADSAVSLDQPDLKYVGHYVRTSPSAAPSPEKEYVGYYVRTDPSTAPSPEKEYVGYYVKTDGPNAKPRSSPGEEETAMQSFHLFPTSSKQSDSSLERDYFPPWYMGSPVNTSQLIDDVSEHSHSPISNPGSNPFPSPTEPAGQSPSTNPRRILIQSFHKYRIVITPKMKRRWERRRENQKRLRAIARAFVREFRNALPWFPMHKASRLSAAGVSLVLRGRALRQREWDDDRGEASGLDQQESKEVWLGKRGLNVIVTVKEVGIDTDTESDNESGWMSDEQLQKKTRREKTNDFQGKWMEKKQKAERSGMDFDRWFWHWA